MFVLKNYRLKGFKLYYFPIVALGHDHKKTTDIINLNIYDDTLSSSVYEKTKLKKVEHLASIGLDFYKFCQLLLEAQLIGFDKKIIVRMNCEGAELGVIQGINRLVNEGFQVKSVIGSLADVKKIHGEDKYNEMLGINANQIRYTYFKGTNLNTWQIAINEVRESLAERKVNFDYEY